MDKPMNFTKLFLLYSDHQPLHWEYKDTSHGEDDFRCAVFAQWEDRKLVIKITYNDFTSPHRVETWQKTAAAYLAMGYYCPQIIANRNENIVETVEYGGRQCVVYAEEFSRYKAADQFEKKIIQNGRNIYHDSALRFLCTVGTAQLDFADFPSGLCILERFCPSDPCDEVMECALEFKEIMEKQFPEYQKRFQRIWNDFLANRDALAQIYGQLPVSVFQADLNSTNILLDDDLQFVGILDFNLCGRDAVLNVLFRELWINFDEDSLDKRENNMYYAEKNNEAALQSFLHNIMLAKEIYPFTELERQAAPLLYRYLRLFWWRPLRALKRDKDNSEKVGCILDWIEKEQAREIDFETIMGRVL